MYGSGIKALDSLAGELEGNSELTFGDLNSEVSKHSSAIEEVRCIWHLAKFVRFLVDSLKGH